ncbi:MAG TPA: hypothetical protein VFW45_02710 [Candidatus Polarisedimenticolia bacterium]|nr:hypothetical protein [Candidatus Polarisedimenticolia bacterium]
MRETARAAIATGLLAAGAAACALGHPVKMLHETRSATPRSPMSVSLELPAGEIRVERLSSGELLYDLQLSYCTQHFTPHSRFTPAAGSDASGDRLEAAARRLEGASPASEPNLLLLKIPVGHLLDLRAATGDRADLDLTGLSLRRLTLHAGSGRLRARFKAGNPADLERLLLVAGTGESLLEGLGWGGVLSLEFHGGAGNSVIDFSGAGPAEAAALVDRGAGNIEMVLPRDLGVVVSGIDPDAAVPQGFRVSGGGWESLNAGDAARRLRLVLQGGSEGVSFRWLP